MQSTTHSLSLRRPVDQLSLYKIKLSQPVLPSIFPYSHQIFVFVYCCFIKDFLFHSTLKIILIYFQDITDTKELEDAIRTQDSDRFYVSLFSPLFCRGSNVTTSIVCPSIHPSISPYVCHQVVKPSQNKPNQGYHHGQNRLQNRPQNRLQNRLQNESFNK